MEQNNEPIADGEVKLSSPLLKKLENFWYHYKWHSIVAVFIIIAVTVMSLQMCNKTSYDAYILYAGTHEISKSYKDGDAPYNTAVSSLKRVVQDFDEDGNVNISLLNLFVLNADEIDAALEGTDGMEINQALITEDTETLRNNLYFGEYYVCFLSERLFLEYDKESNGAMFVPVADYISEGTSCKLASERGIYLGSLSYYSMPEICNLPADTVVCLRKISDVSTLFGKEENEKNFERGEIIFRNIINYKQ